MLYSNAISISSSLNTTSLFLNLVFKTLILLLLSTNMTQEALYKGSNESLISDG